MRANVEAKMDVDQLSTPQWHVFDVPERIDALNFKQFQDNLSKIISNKNIFIALNMNETKFLSLVCIQYLAQIANELGLRKGQLVLVGVGERLIKQISIYSSTKTMKFISDLTKLKK